MKKTFKSRSPSEQRVISFYHQVEIKYLKSSIVFHFCIHSLLHLRQKEKEKKDNKWMNTGPCIKQEKKEENMFCEYKWKYLLLKNCYWFLLLLLFSSFYLKSWLKRVVASDEKKKVFAAASILGPKQIFTSQFLTPIVKLSFGKKMLEFAKAVKCDWI